MKKIVNQPKGLRLDGVVDNEGVGFIPTKEAGPASVQTSGFFATADENGNINCDVIYPDYRSPEEDEEYNAHDMMHVLRYAETVYYDKKREWNKIIDRAMAADFSWNVSANKYQEMYDWLIG